jgi:predicted O-methyltransferase YrrM
MAAIKDIIAKYAPSQGRDEMAALIRLVKKIKPKVVVEIGVHQGRSMAVWGETFKPDLLFGVEPNAAEINWSLIVPFGGIIQIGKSEDENTHTNLGEILKDREIDFLFIDGDHTYEKAKADFINYLYYMRPGGIVAIHDVMLEDDKWIGLVETNKLFKEIVDSGDFKTQVIHSDGTGVGVVFV